MPNYPTSLDALANPTSTTLRNDPGFSLAAAVSTLNDIAEALEAKLGTGASTPGASAGVLRRTAAGASAWARAAAGDYAPGSIATADLAAHAATNSAYLTWTSPTVYGAGAYANSGGSIVVPGLIAGSSYVVSIVTCAILVATLNTLLSLGLGLDAVAANIAETNAVAPAANTVMQMSIAAGFAATAASHTIYPVTKTSVGTHQMYLTQIHAIIVLHR